MQKLQVIGNVTKDASINNVNGRNAINFNVAVNESYKNKEGVKVEKATFYSCSIWREQGQSVEVAKYLLKGTKVFIEGKPSSEIYVKDNVNRIDCRINVAFVELLSAAKKNDETERVSSDAGQGAADGDDLPF